MNELDVYPMEEQNIIIKICFLFSRQQIGRGCLLIFRAEKRETIIPLISCLVLSSLLNWPSLPSLAFDGVHCSKPLNLPDRMMEKR